MSTVKLYNNHYIPTIGYGTHPNKDILIHTVQVAYQAGYRLFDTSDNYYNEEFLGKGISKISDVTDIQVITKYSVPRNIRHFFNDFNRSRAKLCKDIDIYLLHWPYPYMYVDLWKKMEELYEKGEVKAIGVCNFEYDKLKKLLAKCKIKPMINQIELHPYFQQKETSDFCRENNIAVMSYSPLARMNEKLISDQILLRIAKIKGKTIPQIILKWNIQHGYIPIPSGKKEEHIISNIDLMDFELTNSDISDIDSLDNGMRIRFDPKTRFSTKNKIRYLGMHIQNKFAPQTSCYTSVIN